MASPDDALPDGALPDDALLGTGPPDAGLLDELVALATDLARRAGALLLEGQATLPAVLGRSVVTKTTRTDLASEVDHASERLLLEGILAARPDDGVLGEEGTDRSGTSGVRWVLDPLDGTTNFLYGLPGFAVSIGVEVEGATAVGVVLDPSLDELFVAVAGRGATRDGAPISCTAVEDLGLALVGTGFGYDASVRAEQAEVLRHVLPRVRDIRRFGAAAVDLCWVACGRLDGYFERGLQPWDRSAGTLIAAEAGAVVGGLRDEPASGALTLAAAPGIAQPLRALLVEAGFPGA